MQQFCSKHIWSAVAALCAITALGQTANRGAVEEIQRKIVQYAQSIDRADPQLGAKVWLNSPEVSMLHPAGHEHGWEEVRLHFYEQTMGAMFSKRRLQVREVAVHTSGDVAYAEFNWDFYATPRDGGVEAKTSGRETQIYFRRKGEWRLVHVHYSAMPVKGA